MRTVKELAIFLASPSDVQKERDLAAQVVEDVNRTLRRQHAVRIDLVRWETHTLPGWGDDGQAVLNEQIGDMSQYDLFVGILWNRYGQPTLRAGSGTEEEFERAFKSLREIGRPEIWLYFNQAASTLDAIEETEQRKKVLEFRARARQQGGLTQNYSGPNEFRRLFQIHLPTWVNSKATEEPPKQRVTVEPIATLTEPPALVPPVTYQVNAITQILDHLHKRGHDRISLPEFVRFLRLPLRDGIDPIYEPLSISAVSSGLNDLVVAGKIRREGDDLIVLTAEHAGGASSATRTPVGLGTQANPDRLAKVQWEQDEFLKCVYRVTGPNTRNGMNVDRLAEEMGWDLQKALEVDDRLKHKGFTQDFVHGEFTLTHEGIDRAEQLLAASEGEQPGNS